MNKAFFLLYAIIVLSVIVIGWSVNKLWEAYSPEAEVAHYGIDLLAIIEKELSQYPEERIDSAQSEIQNTLNSHIEILHTDELANSGIMEQLNSGEAVVINNAHGHQILYKKIKDKPWIVSIHNREFNDSTLPIFLLVLFYVGIALVIFFWFWPLSRDLNILEQQTRLFGENNKSNKVKLHPGSAVYQLAQAFNQMAKRIRELIASREEMTYAVSHELRTPLARMKFALEMAGETEEPQRIKKHLVGIRQDVNEMDTLVNKLLDYASFEQDHQELELQRGHMGSLLAQLVTRLRDNDEKDMEFSIQDLLDEELVSCEWNLMERAVLNLLQNGVRFAKSQVLISLKQDNNQYILTVEDDGPGIAEQHRQTIWQPFVRLQSKENSQARGFGLGLAIVKRIVKWHQGDVYVDTSPLGGARFTLHWPVD